MKDRELHVLVETVEEWSIAELCQRHLLDEAFVIACVDCGVIVAETVGSPLPRPEWRFPAEAVMRMEKARRLQRDLDLAVADMGLVLDLLEEVELLRLEVDTLRTRLRHWEQDF